MGKLRAVIALTVLAWTTGAAAQTVPGKEYAKKLFEEGVELEKKSDFSGALAKYKEAESITATAGLRFHEAYCLEMTNKLAAAADMYESAVKTAHEQGKGDVEKTATTRLDALRPRVPMLSVKLVSPQAAEVKLDGVVLAPLLLDGKPFRVDPGEHTVLAQAAGYALLSKTMKIDERASTSVEIALERTTAPAPAAVAKPSEPAATYPDVTPPSEQQKHSKLVPIVATAAAGAFLAAGIVSFLVAGSTQHDARSTCPAKASCDSERSKVRTLDAFALTGFIGAAGFGALAIVTWASTSSSSAARAQTRVVAGPGTLRLEGSF